MNKFKKGSHIEYALHGVSWQDDGTPLCHDEEEHWAKGTVLSIYEPPENLADHRIHGTHDQVPHARSVKIEPADGSPPFDIDERLVRTVQ